jgi:acetyltransferase
MGVTVQPMVSARGYELIVGATADAQFGPVLLFGLGGRLVEVLGDRALGLPPLTTTLARRMMERTKIYRALFGVRGEKQVDLASLERLLVRFAELAIEQRRIKEVEINPLLASAGGLIALDARVVLHDPALTDSQLPSAAIRAYPVQYAGRWRARDGNEYEIRPIRPEDEPLVASFHERLSQTTVYMRYASAMRLSDRVRHERLARVCFIDYRREIALVGTEGTGPHAKIIAIGRLIREHDANEAEFALTVEDERQRQGIGAELLRRLVDIARQERIGSVVGYILADNTPMLRVCERLGFVVEAPAATIVTVRISTA